jgi:hypothetical protein
MKFRTEIIITWLVFSIQRMGLNSASKYSCQDADLHVEFCDECQIFLGGLFPVHAPKSNDGIIRKLAKKGYLPTDNTDEENIISPCCGEIKSERGIQRLEAMLYAIDLINMDKDFLPNIKLGAKIYDTCDQETIALDKAMNFVKDSYLLNQKNFAEDFICEDAIGISNGSSYKKIIQNKRPIIKRKVVGVVGPSSSLVSMQVAHFLRLFKVCLINTNNK